ncbi:MAG: PAS domain S-box protein [Alphaproteobacteria bacterium]|uniref:histidine kinase n=1 Tax=Candidatus Nitrobium versatile TaxID=2884831 RepID=A0A953JGQ2_9BACT|nr:PAS domain S-box protein [Candidatus Nitrobium versatile]
MKNPVKTQDRQHNEGSVKALEACPVQNRDFRELYQKLLEVAPDAMIFVEKSGRLALVNAQAERLFGYSREELIGGDVHMLIPERFRKQHRENISRFFAQPRTRPMGSGLKIYARRKDGTEFRADISLSPLEIDGEVLVIAAIRDISERVRAEEQIEFDYQVQRVISTILKIALEPVSLDEQLGRILELIISITDPALEAKGLIYLLDAASGEYVLKARNGFSETGETSPEEIPEYPKPEVQPGLSCEVSYTGHADAPYEMIYTHRSSFGHYCIPICEGGTILGLLSIFAKEWPMARPREEVFFRAVAHTLAIIIKRSQTEAERKKLLERLSQAEKLAALGRISANVAHEIRNPLTVVGGFARRLQRSAAQETREREYADFIVSEVSRLEEILRDVLSYARTTTLQLREYRIHEIIDDVLKMYEERCSQHSVTVRKSYRYADGVVVDKNRAREVIINIVANALDAMPGGGTLTAGTAQEDVEGKPFVTVTISDTGEGIPADRLNKIFEPFFTTKVTEKGVGLGLSISRKIMEDHGGFITVESVAGKGTTFTLYFPQRKIRNTESVSSPFLLGT